MPLQLSTGKLAVNALAVQLLPPTTTSAGLEAGTGVSAESQVTGLKSLEASHTSLLESHGPC